MKKAFLCIVIFSLFIKPGQVIAQSIFSTDYIVNYEVLESGKTNVTTNIILTNKLSKLYANDYILEIASKNIQNIKISSKNKTIIPKVRHINNRTKIIIPLEDKITGFGKTHEFTVSYEATDIAVKSGNIWEITIPSVTDSDDISSYTVTFSVPESFGEPAYILPKPDDGDKWTLKSMRNGGILAAYGDMQYFTFQLSYFLENKSSKSTKKSITLPSEGIYQKVFIESIDPKPENVVIDNDGNWLATYKLQAKKSVDISVQGSGLIFIYPQTTFQNELTDEKKKQYLQAQKYWESDFVDIVLKAHELNTPRAIYDFVVKHLTYKSVGTTEIDRKGARIALLNPDQAMCMEFSDLFIALARAAGIPARLVQGFAYTSNPELRPLSLITDVLHAWPEYYDENKKVWIPVDPTWANTTGGLDYFSKLGFSRVSLATLGINSDYPYPAGSFRKIGRKKDVLVSFVDEEIEIPESSISVLFNIPKISRINPVINGEIKIQNTGSSLFTASSVDVLIDSLSIESSFPRTFQIPPFGNIRIPVSIKADDIKNNQGNMQLIIDGHEFSHKIRASNFELLKSWIFKFWLAGFIFFVIIAVFYKKGIVPAKQIYHI